MLNIFKKRPTRDMTQGPIMQHLVMYTLPLLFGSVFQILYSTVDAVVVGNFVSVQALAAVGATAFITNILVFFFTGFSTGASVVIGRAFGAKDEKKIQDAVSTAITMTFIFCIAFTIIGVAFTNPVLKIFATPDDVFADAATYLRIYFAGISGLLLLNILGSILRAVGDSVHPLIYLAVTNILNTILDLVFVLAFKWGIAGVALATIISQFISAIAMLILLSRTNASYRIQWNNLHINPEVCKDILSIGLPAGIQSIIGAVSNAIMQGYINVFGSTIMAGWSCYNKLNSFVSIPMNSLAIAATIMVSQNLGAKKIDRVRKGIRLSNWLTLGVTGAMCALIFILAKPMVSLFNQTPDVVYYGSLFIYLNIFPLALYGVSHTLTGSLRGLGDSKNVMYMKLIFFVALRQIYLFFMTRFVANTPVVVALSVPFSWIIGAVAELIYFKVRWGKRLASGEVDV